MRGFCGSRKLSSHYESELEVPKSTIMLLSEDLAQGPADPQQSSTNNDLGAVLAVDNTDSTCTQTLPDRVTGWRRAMDGHYFIHHVVISTGLAFGCEAFEVFLCTFPLVIIFF